MLSTEELLKPRIIVENLYPNCPFKAGEILTKVDGIQRFVGKSDIWIDAKEIGKYPYLFRELNWWEEREEKDFPDYLKYNNEGHTGNLKVYKVVRHGKNGFNIDGHSWNIFSYTKYLPATKEEYENQKIKSNE